MQKSMSKGNRKLTLLVISTLGIFSALILLPYHFASNAEKIESSGLNPQTSSHDKGLENYDIRSDKASHEKIEEFRQSATASSIADIRDGFARGEEDLRTTVPTLVVDYNLDIRTPEVIAPDVKKGRNFLTGATSANRVDILRNFVKGNNELVGISTNQADSLKTLADYTNPDGNLSYAHLEQRINGIPVFRGEVKAGFTKNGEMIRIINNLAPGLDYESLSTDFRDPLEAVKSAFRHINSEPTKLDVLRNDTASNDLKTIFGNGDWATTAEKMYFPTEPGVARTAWRVLIWQPVNAYYVIVDAETGTMLWRKNITEDQLQSATYQVYTNSNAMINSADSPAPMTPGPLSPLTGTQGAIIPARTSVSRIGNEAPNHGMNNLGWITDGFNVTDGNNLEAGIDRDGINGVDAPQVGSPNRVFSSAWNPPPGNPAPGDSPLNVEAQRGAVIQMFYAMNLYHDVLYSLGWNESSFNFQNNNFGRGGVGNDRVSAEGQDSSGSNNANFATPADGGRGRMQMYIWTGPNPDYDGTTDIDIIIHEVTHGLSNRLHGNALGLSTNMARGMGEGWGDFYGHAMLSEPTDPINGIYTTGGYATYQGAGGNTNNYYYGIRRFPKAVRAFTGGAGNLPHNPLTFADADSTQINTSDGAFPRGPFGSSTADQVHNLGEIWSTALWEVRAKFVTRLGWATGNRKALQFVTDGMKLSPLGPTFIQSRDAILAAAQASSAAPEAAADVADTWSGFAIRGMGFGAAVADPGTGTSNTRVVESFALPNLLQTPAITVDDSIFGDGDGFPEPGESIVLGIPLTNSTGNDANDTILNLNNIAFVDYGTISNGSTVVRNISFSVPSQTPCGSSITLNFNVNSSLGATSFTRSVIIGVPATTFTENFDSVTAPAFPAGWTATVVQNGTNFVTTATNPDTPSNSAFALDPLTVGGGTDLTSPMIPITASAAAISFRNNYNTEAGWDGGVLEISINGGAFQDIITAGGSFLQNGYNGVLGSTGLNNPLAGRNAWQGNSGGYLTTIAQLPTSAAGQNVQFKWRFGADDNTAATGWNVDTIRVIGSYGCSFSPTAVKSRVDFDGDGKTDIGIYRTNVGQWWAQQSSTLATKVDTFGGPNDTPIPADFTGDGKADVAFFRASSSEWFVLRSEDSSFFSFPFGATGDIPVPADFDNDNKTDPAIFRPSTATWFILQSNGPTRIETFGAIGDRPVPGDYDGDGKADKAIFRPSVGQWWINRSSDNATTVQTFGTSTDKTVQGDYTGDRKTDVAFWRPSTGEWFILRSENFSFYAFPFGTSSDLPVPGDYDGDGKLDPGVFRPSNVTWYVQASTAGQTIQSFGASGDFPIPNTFVR